MSGIFSKINVISIITDHFKTFRSIRTGKIQKSDFFLFIIFPFFIGIYFILYKCFTFKSDHINILIASLSILAGFLFNLLAMVFGFMDKLKENAENDVKKLLVKEIHVNISFSILLSIFCILFLLFCYIDICILKKLFNILSLSFCISFFLTLLMVLKRIYIIMSKEL